MLQIYVKEKLQMLQTFRQLFTGALFIIAKN